MMNKHISMEEKGGNDKNANCHGDTDADRQMIEIKEHRRAAEANRMKAVAAQKKNI